MSLAAASGEILNLEFSEELRDKYNLKPLTKADKALILGGNYARIVDLEVEKAKKRIADDEFAQERARTGRQPPYSNWMNWARQQGIVRETRVA